MKKIAISLSMIAFVAMLAVGATSAYFSSMGIVGGNQFATGTVRIGDLSGQHIIATNLAPGVWSTGYAVNVPYQGSLNADIYAGARGTSLPGEPQYIANKLLVKISDGANVVYYDWASNLSTNWVKIASDVSQGMTKSYILDFYLDPSVGNDKQGVTNYDTQFVVYAVQAGVVDLPLTPPYQTWSFNGNPI